MSTPHHLKKKTTPKKRMSATAGSSSDVTDSTVATPPTVPVARHRLENYGNTDIYAAPDAASSGAEVETHESLMARDLDNKLPIVLSHRQMDNLVEFMKARPIFYDKKSTSLLNTNKRLLILKEWADAEGLMVQALLEDFHAYIFAILEDQ